MLAFPAVRAVAGVGIRVDQVGSEGMDAGGAILAGLRNALVRVVMAQTAEEPREARAVEILHVVQAICAVVTRVWHTVVDVLFALVALEA